MTSSPTPIRRLASATDRSRLSTASVPISGGLLFFVAWIDRVNVGFGGLLLASPLSDRSGRQQSYLVGLSLTGGTALAASGFTASLALALALICVSAFGIWARRRSSGRSRPAISLSGPPPGRCRAGQHGGRARRFHRPLHRRDGSRRRWVASASAIRTRRPTRPSGRVRRGASRNSVNHIAPSAPAAMPMGAQAGSGSRNSRNPLCQRS